MRVQFCQCDNPTIRCDDKGCRCTRCGLPENPMIEDKWGASLDVVETLQKVILRLHQENADLERRIEVMRDAMAVKVKTIGELVDKLARCERDLKRRQESIELLRAALNAPNHAEGVPLTPADDSPPLYERRTPSPSPVQNPNMSIREVMYGSDEYRAIMQDAERIALTGIDLKRAIDFAQRWSVTEIAQYHDLISRNYKSESAVVWIENRRRNSR